jgi:hypothetical protein
LSINKPHPMATMIVNLTTLNVGTLKLLSARFMTTKLIPQEITTARQARSTDREETGFDTNEAWR